MRKTLVTLCAATALLLTGTAVRADSIPWGYSASDTTVFNSNSPIQTSSIAFKGSSSVATGTLLSGAPKDAGTYTVRASFSGNGNYLGDHADATVTVSRAQSTVHVSWSDWTFDTTAHLPSGSITGVLTQTPLQFSSTTSKV